MSADHVPPGVDVDWAAAARVAGRLAHPGPSAPRADREQLVAELRDAAGRALPIAVRAGRLGPALEAAGQDPDAPRPAHVLVVDRPGWAQVAARSFAALAGASSTGASSTGASSAVPSRASTLQAGALLGLLAGRVVGQYDPFTALGAPTGQGHDPGTLLLVAPNVLQVERALSADPSDFRLWVCVHEQTHALQFAAAPWLAQHLADGVGELVADLADSSPWQDARGLLEQGRAVLAGRSDDDSRAPLQRLLAPEQQAQLDRISAVMSVLEGHADVVMDAVPRHLLPSRRRLRARMDARRRRTNGVVDRVLRQVLGMEAKLAQYREGAAFVRGVRRYGGRQALDPLWSGPAALPESRELTDPRAWVRRVHG